MFSFANLFCLSVYLFSSPSHIDFVFSIKNLNNFCTLVLTASMSQSESLLRFADECRLLGHFNDVTVKVGTQIFAANRLVLACYSNYFNCMFKSKMKEQYEDEVEVKNYEADDVMVLLEYIYTQNLVINNENVMSLLAVADYLQIDSAKRLCFEFLTEALDINNCFVVLTAADMYRNESIKPHVYQFIKENLNQLIIRMEFNELEEGILVSCLEEIVKFGADPVTLYLGIVRWTKHNLEPRSKCFSLLFDKLPLEKLSSHFLETVILKENLVEENFKCYKKATGVLTQILKGSISNQIGILVTLGGQKTSRKVLEVFEAFVDDSRKQSVFPDLPISLAAHQALVFNNVLYCIGGCINCSTTIFSNRVFALDLSESALAWKERAPMNHRRCDLDIAVFQGHVVAAGYWNNGSKPYVEIYVASLNKWIDIAPLRHARSGHELVTCKNRLYAIGGKSENSSFMSSVEQLSSLDGNWMEAPAMQCPRSFFAAVECKGSIYVLGGRVRNGGITKSVEKFDPSENKWVFKSSLNVARYDHAACVLNEKIYVTGGMNDGGNVKMIECYDPSFDTWSVVSTAVHELHRHAAVAL